MDPNPYQLYASDNDIRGSNTREKSFKVSIHTLAQYFTFGPGSYGMSTLKKMTGTERFNQLPDHQKKCLVHNKEECQTQNYLNQVLRECNCIPWPLGTDLDKNQVKIVPIFSPFSQEFTFCGPEKETCVGNQTLEHKSCLVPCTGLYADIEDNFMKHTMQTNVMTGRIFMCLDYKL